MGKFRIALLAMLVAGALAALFARGDGARTLANMPDFRAFYCAGAAVDRGRDPYLAEPLRSCETAQSLAAGAAPLGLVAMPAPLPGYSLAGFALLAHMPAATAALLYLLLLVGSLVAAAVALQRLTGYPPLGIFAALALSGGWVSMGYGQIVPVALAFLCVSAALLARGRPVIAALCAAGATIEPHVALPACAALFFFEPKTRVPLAACAATLAAISIVTTGWNANVEYVRSVLPAHAIAEANDIGQFGLTALLHRLGIDAALSLKLADVSYAAMVAYGIAIGRRLAAGENAPELLVLVPPAFALFAGPFIHTSQMAVAVPALLALLHHFPERRALAASLVIMAIPWLELAENPLGPSLVAVAAATVALSALVLRAPAKRTAAIAAVAVAAAACERFVRTAFPPAHVDLSAQLARASSGSLLADDTWAIHARSTAGTHWYLASHVPAWCGLALLILSASAIAFANARPRRPVLATKG